MDPMTLSTVASGVVDTLVSGVGKTAVGRTSKGLSSLMARRRAVENYLGEVTNNVFYLITYRAAAQRIDDAYVVPHLIDGAISQTFLEPQEFRRFAASVTERIRETQGEEAAQAYADEVDEARKHLWRDRIAIYEPTIVPLESIVAGTESYLVLGEAGSGKSALLAHVCWARLRAHKPRLPIYLSSRELHEHSISNCLERTLTTLQLEHLSSQQLNDRIALYVDGLDEVSPARYHALALELGSVRKRLPDAPLLVCCRAAAYGGELMFLREISIASFDEVQVRSFVAKWFSAVSTGPTGDDFLAAVAPSERLRELTTQPLLLSLMCSAFRRYLDFSRRQTTLFEQCVMTLLWQWDAERTVSRPSVFRDLDLQKRLWLHAAIAIHFHERRTRFLSKRELLEILDEVLPRYGIGRELAESVLEEICSHHGLLVRWTEATYGFGHMALQEFLVGKWLSDERRWDVLMTADRLQDPWWRDTIGLTLGSLSDATEALVRLREEKSVSEIERVRLAAHCLRYDPIVAAGVRDGLVRTILGWYHNGDAAQHDAAMLMLVGIDDEWTGAAIRRSLASELPTRESVRQLLHAVRDVKDAL